MAYPKFPIRPFAKNMPSDLAGHTNGQVPEDLMVLVGRRGSKMHHTAARGWACLMWHAEQAGFRWDLASVDPRTYARQVAMFDGTNPKTWISNDGRYVPEDKWAQATAAGVRWTTDVKAWNGKRWKRRAGTAAAAVPGTSPHGWALAVDLAEQTDDDPAAEGITVKFAQWLVDDDMALRCGFGWSLQSEPWHLQWFVGDDVPEFVIAWERSHGENNDNDNDNESEEDDDMAELLQFDAGDIDPVEWGPSVVIRGTGPARRVNDGEIASLKKKHGEPRSVKKGTNEHNYVAAEIRAYDKYVNG